MMYSADLIALSRRCEEAARAEAARRRAVARFGPFEALIDPDDSLIWVNYAVPVAPLDDATAAEAALADLCAHFGAYGRQPRFEFNAAPWPDLPALLERVGFTCHDQNPLMVCTPQMHHTFSAPGVQVAPLHHDAPDVDLIAYTTIQQIGFGMEQKAPTPERLAAMREQLHHGQNHLALARLHGTPAGAGLLAVVGATGELAGIATRPDQRRHGVAASLSSALVAAFFRAGGELAWLSAADDAAQAVYAKIGFTLIDSRLSYLVPAEGPEAGEP